MSQARDNCITVLCILGDLPISQAESTGLDDGCVRVFQNLGGEFVSRADNNANLVIPAQ